MKNKRKFSRIAMNGESCTVKFRGQEFKAIVNDLSINGLGVSGLEAEALTHGEPITITFQGEELEYVCCSAKPSPTETGKLHVGVQRKSDAKIRSISLVMQYIDCGGIEVACRVLGVNGQQSRVRLLSGDSFEIDSSRIRSMTPLERAETLQNEDQLDMMLQYYSISKKRTIENDGNRESIAALLDVEFGMGS